MASHDFTLLPAPCPDCARVSRAQLEPIRSIMSRRVSGAIVSISDRTTALAALATVYRRLGADLLASFAAPDVVDILAEQFVAACEFLEASPITVGAKS